MEKRHDYQTVEKLKRYSLDYRRLTACQFRPNPLYPDKTYEEFVSRMIAEKKKIIERVLDLY